MKSVGGNISGLWQKLPQQHVVFMSIHTLQLMNPLRLVFSVIIEGRILNHETEPENHGTERNIRITEWNDRPTAITLKPPRNKSKVLYKIHNNERYNKLIKYIFIVLKSLY